jgi:hypothetical protein
MVTKEEKEILAFLTRYGYSIALAKAYYFSESKILIEKFPKDELPCVTISHRYGKELWFSTFRKLPKGVRKEIIECCRTHTSTLSLA